MSRKIVIINGHPDAAPERLCSALARAYQAGAEAAGHQVRRLDVGAMRFPLIRSRSEFEDAAPPAPIAAAQADLLWADHLVVIHPLWLGTAPALLKAFFEQTLRYGFALPKPGSGVRRGQLAGRSARIVVTMGMPGLVYRLVFGGFGVRTTARGIFALCGIRPVRIDYIGNVEGMGAKAMAAQLNRMRTLGWSAG